MANIKPFRALRPAKGKAELIASPPYDVMNSKEAREMAAGNELTFLHINKPEIDLAEDVDLYSEKVYKKGAQNLKKLVESNALTQEDKDCFYLYRQVMGEHSQVGLVAGASVEEYQQDLIKKHELTRVDKEDDRLNHILHLQAQTGPVFLTYKANEMIDEIVASETAKDPVYDFTSDDGIGHTVWVVSDDETINKIRSAFSTIKYLYVADGHHRSAAAARAGDIYKSQNENHTGDEEYNFFLSVIFPHDQMNILDYNRVVKDLNGLSKEEFIAALEENFLVREYDTSEAYKPRTKHDFGMYLDNTWYKLSAIPGSWNEADPVDQLDVSILYKNVLKPILNIGDPRTDKRIDFVGGIRGMEGLKARVDSGEMQVAFSIYHTTIDDLINIAEAGAIMPPKSTWFEPKLRSGLLVHKI